MPINQNFYDLNAGRDYPLDESATGLSDAGLRLPEGLVVDGCLRYPVSLGPYPFLSALHVTSRLVSGVLSVASSRTAPTFLPIAAFSIPGPPEEGVPYQLNALLPGVAGWLVLGDNRETTWSGRFSTAAQGLLLPRIARGYQPFPVPSLAIEGATNVLQGLVNVIPQTDLEILRDRRLIDGQLREALIIRLTGTLSTVLANYTGPAGGRPESNTCDSPPVQRIGPAIPDANGNITLRGLGFVSPRAAENGLLLDTGLAIGNLCQQQTPIPYQGDEECYSVSVISEVIDPPTATTTDEASIGGGGAGYLAPIYGVTVVSVTYPHCVRWFSDLTTATLEAQGSSAFSLSADVPPQFPGSDFGQPSGNFRSLLVTGLDSGAPAVDLLFDPGYSTLVEFRAEAAVKLGAAPTAGLVVDWSNYYGPGEYYTLRLNSVTDCLEYCRFNGSAFETPLASLGPLNLNPGDWYRITLLVTDSLNSGRSDIRGFVTNMTTASLPLPPDTTWFQIIGQPSFQEGNGYWGLYADGTGALFGYLNLDLP